MGNAAAVFVHAEIFMSLPRFSVSLHVIIPLIFAGLSLLSVIGAYHLTGYTLRQGGAAGLAISLWAGCMALASSGCGLVVARLLLRPMERFMATAKSLPVLAAAAPPVSRPEPGDEIQHLTRFFEQVTDVLSTVEAKSLFPEVIVESRAMRGLLSHVMKVAPTDSTVLILGESGTGKELVAASIYQHSRRLGKPFVTINCVAIPEELLESELFGHEKGAFTGATSRKIGKFEAANGGTIFLDEIGDMPLSLQAKLLRVLQERELERVGGTRPIRLDVRFIAATNKNLLQMVEKGRFREDLYHRLNVFVLQVPPLRERRRDDIPILVEHFLAQAPRPARLDDGALQALVNYSWPGNVRELKNTVERASLICEEGLITLAHLPPAMVQAAPAPAAAGEADPGASLDARLGALEKGMIIEALKRTGGVQVRAAALLGINQRSLWHRVKKYGIDVAALK
ncbi:MAG: sigma-54 dependent transcriptional regulator [Thermodesulfobacteriota bacterium]